MNLVLVAVLTLAAETFKDVVGLSRPEVAQALVERFDLEEKARSRMSEWL
jgi:hypothetical protein